MNNFKKIIAVPAGLAVLALSEFITFAIYKFLAMLPILSFFLANRIADIIIPIIICFGGMRVGYLVCLLITSECDFERKNVSAIVYVALCLLRHGTDLATRLFTQGWDSMIPANIICFAIAVFALVHIDDLT